MKVVAWRLGLLACLVLTLAACGGGSGGGGNEPTAPTSPTSEDLANARDAQLKVVLREDTKELTITWIDTFSAESGYRVERRTGASGAWQLVKSLPASSGTGMARGWKGVIDSSATYRVLAQRPNYSVPLETEDGLTEVAVDPTAAVPLTVLLNRPEPLFGTVQMSLQGAAGAVSVSYFIDLVRIGVSTQGPGFAVTWDMTTTGVADGDHFLIVQIHNSTGPIVELRRTLVVDDPNLNVTLSFTRTPNELMLNADATSDRGIRSVEFFRNDASLGVLTAPNDRGRFWLLRVPRQDVPFGPATFRVVATDNISATVEARLQVNIDDEATLSIDSPLDGEIVSGQLHVAGSFTDDQAGTLVTAWLEEVEVLQTTTSPFATDYSLTSIPEGSYNFGARVLEPSGRSNSTNRQVVVNTTPFQFELVTAGVKRLLATEHGALLYETEAGTVILRKPDDTEVTLNIPAGLSATDSWQLSGNHVVMTGKGALFTFHIYLFDELGNATNVSATTGSTSNLAPVLRGKWLAWQTSVDRYAIYNLDTEERVQPAPPAGIEFINLGDFVTTPGDEQLLFSAGVAATAVSDKKSEIYRNLLASDTTEAITNTPDVFENKPLTDNARVAWQDEVSGEHLLFSSTLSDLTTVAQVGAEMTTFQLRDGLLAWHEDFEVRVNDGSSTTTLATQFNCQLFAVADGDVIFGQESADEIHGRRQGKLYVWNSGSGSRAMLDAIPNNVLLDDKIAFVQSRGLVYRVHLP